MPLYSFGRLLCTKCGRMMQMTVVTIDENCYGGKTVEFECTSCGDAVALPLNLESVKREEQPPSWSAG